MNSILRICIPSTLCVVAQHTEVLTVCPDPTPRSEERRVGKECQ